MDETTPLKCCKKCSRSFPATPKFFYRRREAKDGLRAACIACENPTRKPPKEPDPEGMKRCSKCGQLLPATLDFFRVKRNGFGEACKTCANAQGRAYYAEHKEERKAYFQSRAEVRRVYSQQYHATHKEAQHRRQSKWYQLNKEEVKEYQRQYNKTHSELIRKRSKRYRSEHRERLQEQKKAYYSSPQGRIRGRVAWHKRQARKKSVQGALTPQQIQAKLKSQKYRCYYSACGHTKFKKVNGKYIYHLEHTIPLSRTESHPRHDVDYVVLACPTCNMRKGTKLPHEWNEGGRLF